MYILFLFIKRTYYWKITGKWSAQVHFNLWFYNRIYNVYISVKSGWLSNMFNKSLTVYERKILLACEHIPNQRRCLLVIINTSVLWIYIVFVSRKRWKGQYFANKFEIMNNCSLKNILIEKWILKTTKMMQIEYVINQTHVV